MIRWVTPVRHFMRYAQEDRVLGGTPIRKGERLLLSYLSANRDEAVFPDPFRFDVRRANASDHLAFGIGVHFCLGAHLARMELRAFFRELLPRLESIELAGEPSTPRRRSSAGRSACRSATACARVRPALWWGGLCSPRGGAFMYREVRTMSHLGVLALGASLFLSGSALGACLSVGSQLDCRWPGIAMRLGTQTDPTAQRVRVRAPHAGLRRSRHHQPAAAIP